jgi:hypothetical protein
VPRPPLVAHTACCTRNLASHLAIDALHTEVLSLAQALRSRVESLEAKLADTVTTTGQVEMLEAKLTGFETLVGSIFKDESSKITQALVATLELPLEPLLHKFAALENRCSSLEALDCRGSLAHFADHSYFGCKWCALGQCWTHGNANCMTLFMNVEDPPCSVSQAPCEVQSAVAPVAFVGGCPTYGVARGPLSPFASVSRRHHGIASFFSVCRLCLYSPLLLEADPEVSSDFMDEREAAVLYQAMGLGSKDEYLEAMEAPFLESDEMRKMKHGT